MQRMTRQREAIWRTLREEDRFMSAQGVHELLSRSGSNVGLATVYRNLQALAESGAVDVLRQEGSETQLFRYCDAEQHHHHLVCRSCGNTVEIAAENVEQWAAATAADYGFTAVSHSLEIYGLCAQCSAHQAKEQ